MGVYVHVYNIHIHIFVIIRAVIDIPMDTRVSGSKTTVTWAGSPRDTATAQGMSIYACLSVGILHDEAYVVKDWGLEMDDMVENISAQSAEVREEEIATHRDNRYRLRLWAENYN